MKKEKVKQIEPENTIFTVICKIYNRFDIYSTSKMWIIIKRKEIDGNMKRPS